MARSKPALPADDPGDVDLVELVARLAEAERAIRVATGGEIDAVLLPGAVTPFLLRDAQEALLRAKNEAELANRAKSEFLAAMSHELRTPLNAILGFSEAMLSGVLGDIANARHRGYIADIFESGRHLLGLVNDILDIATIEAGKLGMHAEECALPEIVAAALLLVERRAQGSGVRIDSRIAEPLPRLFVDRRRVKQVLVNLLSNAVKFTPRGGTVSVSAARTPDGGLTLAVADDGIGMDAEELALALAPFGQSGDPYVRTVEGSGLGLPLSQGLMAAHEGTLEIVSTKGVGTTVTAYFPKDRVVG
ncbi:MAG: hypothetical protein HZC25_02965 [Rhodospirillales bacterium]|nr:hypothetical protein [Rhodospirillales bacterium]